MTSYLVSGDVTAEVILSPVAEERLHAVSGGKRRRRHTALVDLIRWAGPRTDPPPGRDWWAGLPADAVRFDAVVWEPSPDAKLVDLADGDPPAPASPR